MERHLFFYIWTFSFLKALNEKAFHFFFDVRHGLCRKQDTKNASDPVLTAKQKHTLSAPAACDAGFPASFFLLPKSLIFYSLH